MKNYRDLTKDKDSSFQKLLDHKILGRDLLCHGRARQRDIVKEIYPEDLASFDIDCAIEKAEEGRKIQEWVDSYKPVKDIPTRPNFAYPYTPWLFCKIPTADIIFLTLSGLIFITLVMVIIISAN